MKRPGDSLDTLPVHERIRRRREQLGMTATEVAKRAGISPSYISLIEKGAKVPHERVALRLARALGDDPDLYLAWAHAARHDDLTIFDRMRPWLRASSDDPEFAKRVASGKRLQRHRYRSEEPAAAESVARRMGPTEAEPFDEAVGAPLVGEPSEAAPTADEPSRITLVEIPVLEEGADPGEDPSRSGAVLETLRMDRRALPPGPIDRPFAYRPGPQGVRRVSRRIHPGDLVVLTSTVGRLAPDRIHAVRHGGRIVLTRVLFKKRALLMLPAEGSDEFEVLQVGSRSELDRLIAGTVILTTRYWVGAETASRGSALATGAAKLKRFLGIDPSVAREAPVEVATAGAADVADTGDDERLIVRDCHWKEKYGWRPIQRREDLETLEAHPGMRIRFRLFKGDRVRYHLEMDADEWRDALGDYGGTPGWRRNGYITPVTRMREGQYTTDFKDRWAPYVREA